MPWKATDELKERTKFVLEWERRWDEARGGRVNMVELCRMFGISRQTGYTLVRRYRDSQSDLAAVAPRSRRPRSSPTAVAPEMEDLIVEARKKYPRWGARKLHVILVERHPQKPVPSPSAIAKVLKRRGMTATRRRRSVKTDAQVTKPFAGCDAANEVWCIDFKGWFVIGDGRRCYPLTLVDGFSRYLLRCEGLLEPNGEQVQRILDSAFLEFGLPKAIRSDNGPPFASTGPAHLSRLSVWLLRLGIDIELIAPAEPQQNGRLERFHRTLHEGTASPPARDIRAQQRVFDSWRGQYNQIRPHEALAMRRPAEIYVRSKVDYPRPLVPHLFEPTSHVSRLDRNGAITWQRRSVLISSALRYEHVEIEHSSDVDGRWNVKWGEILLGHLDEHRAHRCFTPVRRPRGNKQLSRMSFR